MTKYLLTATALAVGSFALFGCESNGQNHEESRTQQMSNVQNQNPDTPAYNHYMQGFDHGIGDSGTETGGGGNGPQ
jgi:hypothetical protein